MSIVLITHHHFLTSINPADSISSSLPFPLDFLTTISTMSFPIDESSLFTSHHIYKAALIFAVVRWIIAFILKFIDSSSTNSDARNSITAQMIRDSLELTTTATCTEPCAVCLNRLEADDAVRRLRCCHVFHAECIDKWIDYDHEHVSCPLCRAALVGPNGSVKSEPSWAAEQMLYIFAEDNDLHM